MSAVELCKAIWKSLDYHRTETVEEMKKKHDDAFQICWLHHMGWVTPKAAAVLKLTLLWEDLEKIRESRLKEITERASS